MKSMIDNFAKGGWASNVPKMDIAFWKILWNKIHTFARIRRWGRQDPEKCFLCANNEGMQLP